MCGVFTIFNHNPIMLGGLCHNLYQLPTLFIKSLCHTNVIGIPDVGSPTLLDTSLILEQIPYSHTSPSVLCYTAYLSTISDVFIHYINLRKV